MGFLADPWGWSKADVWAEVARDIGGSYDDGGASGRDVLRYQYDEWQITLDTFELSSSESTTTYTRMRAPFQNKCALYFRIYRAGPCASIAAFFGMRDIRIGDQQFDDDFVIQGNDHDQVRWLLNDPTLRDLIQAAVPPSLMALGHPTLDSMWFGACYPDQLYFQCGGVLREKSRLKTLFELFRKALATLAQLDSSSNAPIPSGRTVMYEKPDGWSRVVCELPEHAVVTVLGTEGHFLKVTTAEHIVGYIAQSRRDHVVAITPA